MLQIEDSLQRKIALQGEVGLPKEVIWQRRATQRKAAQEELVERKIALQEE